jgi:NAD(P)-dependent dehydrogenase (short-subunit alcohol dehydrogenase family)
MMAGQTRDTPVERNDHRHDADDMNGQSVLITGGTGGIGYETARALVRRGACVIVTGRDAHRGEQALVAIRRESGRDSVTFMQVDHSTVGGNQQLADRVRDALSGLDVLVNNVGGLYGNRWETADGYEGTLAMNFVGPFTLTGELLPLLEAKAPSRCINVVSAAFQMWKRDPFDDVQSRERFVSGDAYAQTKLLNVLFSLALARRIEGKQITVNIVHPGVSWTAMTQATTPNTVPAWKPFWPILRLMQRRGSPEKAAARVAFLASSPEVTGSTGAYFMGKPTPRGLSARELDPENQERAWRLALELVAEAPTSRRRLSPGVRAVYVEETGQD